MRIVLKGAEELANKLQAMNSVKFSAVCTKNLTEIFNRGKQEGGTPVDTGELRMSMSYMRPNGDFGGEVGYTKDYGPHVEYGHRTVDGGFVKGQQYLKKNVDTQRPIFRQDLLKAMKGN